MRKMIFIIVMFLLSRSLYAQSNFSSRVSDDKGAPLSFVSVILLQQDKKIASTATNEQGVFGFPANLETGVLYTVRFSLVGYETLSKKFTWPDTISVFPVVMIAFKTTLGNVTVTATKPLVTRRTDRYIINVENSFLANGNNALEVLQRSPGLWVDNTGNIRIRGSQTVMVMINDVVQRMSQDELTEYLKTLRSEDISRIEVIPNPPAEYEAAGAGGIVHIILKKARKDGINGYVMGQYRQQGREPSGNFASSLDYKSGKLYLLGGLQTSKDVNNSFGHSESIFADNGSFNTVGTRHNDNDRSSYRCALSYDFTKRSTLSIQSSSSQVRMHHTFHNDVIQKDAGKTTTGINETDWIRRPQQVSTNAVYTLKTDSLGSSFKIIGDYTTSSRDETNLFTAIYNDPAQNAQQLTTTPSKTGIYSLQTDLTRILPKQWVFRTGLKYAGIHRDNNVIIEDIISGIPILNTTGSNQFKYNEDIAMAYASAEKTINKLSAKLGLRGEQTWSHGNSVTTSDQFKRSYFGLFPSLFLTWSLNEQKASDLYFSYSRRLQRPGFDQLNPYRLQLSSVVTMVGNPDLQPQYSNNFEFGYHFMKNWAAGLYYTHTTDVISQVSVPMGNKFETKFYNMDQNTSYGFNFDAPITIKKGWEMSNGASLYYLSYTFRGTPFSGTSYRLQHYQSLSISKVVDIDLNAEYSSPHIYANSRVADVFYMDIGFSRKIFKGKIRTRLHFADILNLTRESEATSYLGTYTSFYQKRQTQNVIFTMAYNFSIGKKFSNKQIESGANEEKKRIGN